MFKKKTESASLEQSEATPFVAFSKIDPEALESKEKKTPVKVIPAKPIKKVITDKKRKLKDISNSSAEKSEKPNAKLTFFFNEKSKRRKVA